MRGRNVKPPDSEAITPVGRALRAWREERQLSEVDLAMRAGLGANGRSYISKVEHGVIKRPGPDKLKLLARALGINTHVLKQGISPQSPQQGGLTTAEQRASDLADLRALVRRYRPDLLQALEVLIRAAARVQGHTFATTSASPGKIIDIQIRLAAKRPPTTPLSDRLDFTQAELTILTGQDTILREAIRWLGALDTVSSLPADDSDREIWITFLGEKDYFTGSEPLIPLWHDVLKAALRSGWNVVHFIRRPRTVGKMVDIIHNYILELPIIGGGHYMPFFLTPEAGSDRLDGLEEGHEYLFIPGKIALDISTSRATSQPSDVMWRLSSGQEPFETIHQALMYWRRQYAELLIMYAGRTADFSQALAEIDSAIGDRCLVQDGLSEFLIPIWIHDVRAKFLVNRGRLTESDYQKISSSRRSRQKAVELRLAAHTHHIYELYPYSAFERLINNGRYSLDDTFTMLGAPALTDREQVMVLLRVRRLLQRYGDVYHVGLVDDLDPQRRDAAELLACQKRSRCTHGILYNLSAGAIEATRP